MEDGTHFCGLLRTSELYKDNLQLFHKFYFYCISTKLGFVHLIYFAQDLFKQ